ncbi:hypothetical protein BO71DRAFT_380535 [Aspergillus ellipticus CBS 707.79]|uniref:Zn(2)-C6 fungal-type domain-containing protein n=1 Tax=Aspergillus ellipticus CBS 707.79 TaxID=1448320 RepID=A0A319ESA7_9EURO|nr:hypothetical protein BO71DRAFT_380535 [Aspergillus ellipticus CBS 707.79]
MAPAKSSKVSRITVACNSCRFRKQKCSGNKPICSQCHQHNRPCDWPEQLKRGPAKGYIEALEHRLHETESLLLKLLAEVPDSQLSATIHDTQNGPNSHATTSGSSSSSSSRSTPPHTYAPPLRLGKRGTDYWKRFPLHTVRDIRDWQQDCLSQGEPATRPSSGPEIGNHPSASLPQHQQQQQQQPPPLPETDPLREPTEFNDRRDISPELPLPGIHEIEMSHSPDDGGVLSAKLVGSPELEAGGLRDRENRARIDPVFEAIQYQNARRAPPENVHGFGSGVQKPSLWKGAPSVNFQQQFLW